MLKRTTIIPLLFLALLAGCGKEEPQQAVAPEPAMPETAPMDVTSTPEEAMPESVPAMPEPEPADAAPAPETAAAEAMPEAASAEPTPAPEASMPAETAPPSVAENAMGKKVYEGLCFSCHATGIAGAPKTGDKAAWAARIAQGNETLYMHSIKGFQGLTGVMPPKGGNLGLSDDEVKAAVDHMVAQSQ